MPVTQDPAPEARARRAAPLHARSVRYVKGVGPRRTAQLAALGIETLEDACYAPPRRYEDRRQFLAIADLHPGVVATVRGTVTACGLRRIRRGQTLFDAEVTDGSGVLQALWFNSPYLAQQIRDGAELILHGRLEGGTRRQMIHPEHELLDPEARPGSDAGRAGDPSLHVGRIVPIYALTEGLTQRWYRRFMAAVLEASTDGLEEALPEPLRARYGWPGIAEAVRQLHFPSAPEALEAARARLVFEELLLLQVGLSRRRAAARAATKPQRYALDGPLTRGLRARLPFALTESQERILQELCEDLARPSPMYRLLQGDVGCGKTIVLTFLIALAVQSGYQAAVMAPTELLAEQHARVIGAALRPLGVAVELLSQGVPAAQRAALTHALAAGTLPVAIGTHALIQRGVAFQRLALVVIDEQHKFGVAQRARLARKGARPDVVVLTATPIPRTLALTMYGDLSISTITELPPGRRPVDTLWMHEAQRPELYDLIRRHLAQGRQGYVVYPLVTEGAAKPLRAATSMARRLQSEIFPESTVGLLHGQMAPRQKERIMRRFAEGQVQLLVSTVIVEVGLDVPNATVMVVEHPEQFGLAQLHQLRGRIGRGTHPATCVVVSDATEEAVRARLNAFVQTTDGFQLAEQDLELRGPGALLGRQQHGWIRLRVADLLRDRDLLPEVRAAAEALVDEDPQLQDPAHAALRARLERARRLPG